MILRSIDRHARQLVLLGVVSLVAFITLSLTQPVDGPYIDGTYTVMNASGFRLLIAELFWLSAAAVGATSVTLAAVVRRMDQGRGPGSTLRNWAGTLFGVMAGFILAALFPAGRIELLRGIDIAMIAVVGAFLASIVFRMMTGARSPALDDEGGSATAES